jgi:hypothetical protein
VWVLCRTSTMRVNIRVLVCDFLNYGFLHEYRSWRSILPSILPMNYTVLFIGYCLAHLKVFPKSHFLKMTVMRALRGETKPKFESSESIWKIVTASSI